MQGMNLSKLEQFAIGILAHKSVAAEAAASMAKELINRAKKEGLSNDNEISKQEAFAFELLKHKDVNVNSAWRMAGRLIKETSAEREFKVKEVVSPVNSDAGKTVNIDTSEEVEVFTDTKVADIATLMPFERKLEVDQVWLNLNAGYTREVVASGRHDDYAIARLTSNGESLDVLDDIDFLRDGWGWELMLEDESVEDCKKRVIKERNAMAKAKELQKCIYDEPNIRVQTKNLLRTLGIEVYADLLEKSYDDLYKIPLMGKRRINELMALSKKHGWILGMTKVNFSYPK